MGEVTPEHKHQWAVKGNRLGVVCQNPDDPRACGVWLTQEQLLERLQENSNLRKRIETLERERHGLSEEMMRAVVRSHDETGTKAIWSDVVHGWAVRLAALREARKDKTQETLRALIGRYDDNEGSEAVQAEMLAVAERVEALKQDRDALHAALTVFEAAWDTGGLLDPHDFWEKCWPAVDRLVPPEHQLLTWAVTQQERGRAALRKAEDG